MVQYNVYVALQAGGPYHLVGATTSTSTAFTDGVPGLRYYFRVAAANAAGEESAFVTAGPVASAWSASPHLDASSSTRKCGQCHSVHEADTAQLFLWEDKASGPAVMCLTCHDGQNRDTANVASGTRDSFALKSGHTIEADPHPPRVGGRVRDMPLAPRLVGSGASDSGEQRQRHGRRIGGS